MGRTLRTTPDTWVYIWKDLLKGILSSFSFLSRNLFHLKYMSTDICKLDSQWEFAVGRRELKPGLCDNLEGVERSGKWEGGSRGRGHMYTLADSC